MRGNTGVVYSQRSFYFLCTARVLAPLVVQHPQQMQGIEVRPVHREHLLVDTFGLLQASGILVSERDFNGPY